MRESKWVMNGESFSGLQCPAVMDHLEKNCNLYFAGIQIEIPVFHREQVTNLADYYEILEREK